MSSENESKTGASCAGRRLPTKEDVAEIQERLALQDNLRDVKHKIIVLSGKGGVGKSTVATNIAVSLSLRGKTVGLMDVDIHGPSIPKMLGLEGSPLRGSEEGMLPVQYSDGLKVMSIGFILRDEKNAVIWRAPLKHSMIRQFLTDVRWGELDYLIVDSPPGTGDEPISLAQLLEKPDGGIIVTTPQEVALTDVRKAITFCRQVSLPILGVVENMSGFVCPHCGQTVDIFKRGGGEAMAKEMGLPFLGRIPLEPKIVETADDGKPFYQYFKDTLAAKSFDTVIEPLLHLNNNH